MKLWQLVSALGGETGYAITIASTTKEWVQFGEWLQNFPCSVNVQDREKLDRELPADFVRMSLSRSKTLLFVSVDRTIRSHRAFPSDKAMCLTDAVDDYGGDAIEEALEKGSFRP